MAVAFPVSIGGRDGEIKVARGTEKCASQELWASSGQSGLQAVKTSAQSY
jgi:hypothetical protein